MAVGEIYCVKMIQDYFTVNCLNVFTYEQTGVGIPGLSDAAGLFEAFEDEVLDEWKETVNNSITVNTLEVFQIADPSDNAIGTPINNVGERAITDNLRAPSWVGMGWKSNRAGTGTRSSFKRFAGLGEVDIADQVLLASWVASAPVQALKTVLGAAIAAAGGSEYTPIQVASGWVLGSAPTKNFTITSWLDPVLTSQVSRKP